MKPGTVVWITGLPGAGKTTVSKEVVRLLREKTAAVVRVDGDLVREIWGGELGYGMADRVKNAQRVSRLCKMLVEQGLIVVCATVSLFKETHQWNREHLPNYVEVFLRISTETLHARDQKGLFSGGGKDVIGGDQPYDLPAEADLVIDNDGHDAPSVAAQRIVDRVGLAA